MKFWLLPIFLILVSCAVNNDEKDAPVFCSIDQTEVFQVGTNTTTDFNETNITKDVTFNDTDCPSINNDSFSVFVSRVKRVGNSLQIFERQYQSNQFLLELEIEGTTLLPQKNVVNINNCSVVRNWSGTLNTPANTMTLNEVIDFKGACRSTFFNPDTDKASFD